MLFALVMDWILVRVMKNRSTEFKWINKNCEIEIQKEIVDHIQLLI